MRVSGHYFGLTEVKLCNALVAKAHNNPNVILAKSEPNSTSLKVCYFQAKFSLLFFSFFFEEHYVGLLESEYTNWIIYAAFDQVIEINWRANDDSLFW